jgi:hypothetical protein
VWKLDGKEMILAKHSIFYPDESGEMKELKGNIRRAAGVKGKYYGTDVTVDYVESLSKKITTITSQVYSSDTTFLWNGKLFPTVKFNMHQNAITVNRLFPVAKSEMKFSGATFFAEDLGFVGEYYSSDEPINGENIRSSMWLIGIEQLE